MIGESLILLLLFTRFEEEVPTIMKQSDSTSLPNQDQANCGLYGNDSLLSLHAMKALSAKKIALYC
jgi:hypothetical protein